MAMYDFTLVLTSPTEFTEDFGDRIFSAGCNDSTPSSSQGVVSIDFSRDATDLQSAIRSAIANVSAAGGIVDRVEIDADAPLLRS
jgi:hypothetical protein